LKALKVWKISKCSINFYSRNVALQKLNLAPFFIGAIFSIASFAVFVLGSGWLVILRERRWFCWALEASERVLLQIRNGRRFLFAPCCII